jgi:hypothetical protein
VRYFEFDESDENAQQQVEYLFEEKDERQEYLELLNTGLAAKELNQRVLSIATRILERSFFWRFRSPEGKMNQIQKLYDKLTRMV